MDADRLAAIEEWFVRLSPFIGQGAEAYAYFQELKASIDALQAENERLQQMREDDLVYAGSQEAKLRAENERLRKQYTSSDARLAVLSYLARITLLEGLLREAGPELVVGCNDDCGNECFVQSLYRRIDAALSRSDQNTE